MDSSQKEHQKEHQRDLRRFAREQILQEGTRSHGAKNQAVDILDVSIDQEKGVVYGFGVLAPIPLMASQECTLRFADSKYGGQYLCETVHYLDTGFGFRMGLFVKQKL